MGEKVTKIKRSSIIHFVIITLMLFSIEGYMNVIDITNNGCVPGELCEDYIPNSKIIFFSLFSTFIIIYMAFRIPLFKYTGLNYKYLIFITILIGGGEILDFLLTRIIYFILV